MQTSTSILSPASPSTGSRPGARDDSDLDLLLAWTRRDQLAGELLIGRYYVEISRYFAGVAGPDERHELTQDTFMNLCVSAPKLSVREGFEFRRYLYGIARNILNLHLRRRYRKRAFMALFHQLADHGEDPSPTQILAVLERSDRLIECLRELPADARLLIEQYYWDGKTAGELSDDHGVPAATIRTRIFHLKQRLSKGIDERKDARTEGDFDVQLEDASRLFERGPLQMDRAALAGAEPQLGAGEAPIGAQLELGAPRGPGTERWGR